MSPKSRKPPKIDVFEPAEGDFDEMTPTTPEEIDWILRDFPDTIGPQRLLPIEPYTPPSPRKLGKS